MSPEAPQQGPADDEGRRLTGRVLRASLALVALLGVIAAVAALAGAFESAPAGPVPIAWDHEVCAECHMHIGDPRYAAQIQTSEGDVLNFDDPGCLIRYVAEHRPTIRRMYFHSSVGDAWLQPNEVGFVVVPAEQTPMGYGLAAVPNDTKGALSLEAAEARVAGAGRAGHDGRRHDAHAPGGGAR
ncbi:MAG: hypothetical protein KC543_17000 [Myxococcales bacterium]|nr:hypothetical protein [Myxococcales bacterium]